MVSDFLPLPRANKSLLPSTPWQTTSNNTALNDRNHWRRHPLLLRYWSRHHTASPPIGDLWHRPPRHLTTAPTSRGRSAHEQCRTVRSCASRLGRHLAHCLMGIMALGEALQSAQLSSADLPHLALVGGTTVGNMDVTEVEFARTLHADTLGLAGMHRPNRRALRRVGLRHHLEHRLSVGCQCLHPRSNAHRKWGV